MYQFSPSYIVIYSCHGNTCPNFHSHVLYSSICRGLHAESLHFSVFQFGSDFCCPDLYTQAQRSEREANYIVVLLTRVVKRNDTRNSEQHFHHSCE